jgi:hypothetical protein
MKSIEFYDLPRPTQERFVAAAQASLAPAPLAIKLGSRFVGARWFVAAALVLAATALYAAQGFGDLNHDAALASPLRAAIYSLGFTLSFACLTRGLTLRDRALSLPYARATYLFPVGVVDAMSSSLNVHSLADLANVEATPASLNVTFNDGATFEFPAKDQEQAQAAKLAVTEAQARLEEATRADSVRHMAALDPLCRTNFPSPFSEDVPYKRPTMLWAASLLGMAVVSGAALGVGVWEVRNKLSGRRLVETARALDTTAAYRRYLAHGGQHPEIVDVLLPRAELEEARAQGSVAAIEQYIQAHPHSKIQPEVDEAFRGALLSALETAKAPGTLRALEEFSRAHPAHAPVAAELAEARHQVFRAAYEQASRRLVANDTRQSDPAAFFERLVAHAEEHGPRVEIRFRSQLGKSHNTADTMVRLSAYFGGNSSLPSRYFDDEQMRQREDLAAPLLISALQSLFSPEILRFELGPPLPSPDPDERLPKLPEPSIPTLYVDHRTELSGGTVNTKPRGIFLGAGIFFDTLFVIPGDPRQLKITVPTWRTPSRQVMRNKKRTIGDVYEDLARRSFTLFLRRYLDRVLVEPPDVSMPAIALLPEDDDSEG